MISWEGTYLAEFITKIAKSWLQGTNLAHQWLGLVTSYVPNWKCASLCFQDYKTWLLKQSVHFRILAGQNSEIIWCLGRSMEKMSSTVCYHESSLLIFNIFLMEIYHQKKVSLHKIQHGKDWFFASYICPVCIQGVLASYAAFKSYIYRHIFLTFLKKHCTKYDTYFDWINTNTAL